MSGVETWNVKIFVIIMRLLLNLIVCYVQTLTVVSNNRIHQLNIGGVFPLINNNEIDLDGAMRQVSSDMYPK